MYIKYSNLVIFELFWPFSSGNVQRGPYYYDTKFHESRTDKRYANQLNQDQSWLGPARNYLSTSMHNDSNQTAGSSSEYLTISTRQSNFAPLTKVSRVIVTVIVMTPIYRSSKMVNRQILYINLGRYHK